MRVIAGEAKGRRLVGPKDDSTRPAAAKVKKAIFDILGSVVDCSVLDLYAGSGSVGIEALSRGARQAVFVESARPALKALHRNLELCRFTDRASVVAGDVERALAVLARRQQHFDLIFVDPPYDQNLIMPTLERLEKVLARDGIVVVESSPREGITETVALQISDQRTYGQTLITFYVGSARHLSR